MTTKVNYRKFTKHAEKVAKGKHLSARPILQGIHHDEDGNLAVTDSHRLYYAKNVNAPRNVILHAVTGEEIDLGNYPDVSRIIPDIESAIDVLTITDAKQAVAVLKAMQAAGVATGTKKDEVRLDISTGEGDGTASLSLCSDAVTFDYEVINAGTPSCASPRLSVAYMLEAIDMMSDMGAKSLDVRLYGTNRPILITESGDMDATLSAVILPLRRS